MSKTKPQRGSSPPKREEGAPLDSTPTSPHSAPPHNQGPPLPQEKPPESGLLTPRPQRRRGSPFPGTSGAETRGGGHGARPSPSLRAGPARPGEAREGKRRGARAGPTVDGPQAPVVRVLHMAPRTRRRRHDESAEPQRAAAAAAAGPACLCSRSLSVSLSPRTPGGAGPGRAGGGARPARHDGPARWTPGPAASPSRPLRLRPAWWCVRGAAASVAACFWCGRGKSPQPWDCAGEAPRL